MTVSNETGRPDVKPSSQKHNNKVINADNREVFADLPDDCIDLILTDPPYKDYQSNRPIVHDKVKKINEIDFNLPFFIEQSIRVLKPGAHFYCWCDHKTFPAIYQQIADLEKEALQAKSKNYLKYKNCLVWVKNNHGSGDLKYNYAPQHEFVIYAYKGPKGREINGKRPSNVFYKKTDKSIEFYKRVNNNTFSHGTSKPVEILQKMIEASTHPDELVFDPYAGSMSTGEACLLTSRNYLLVEIDPDFFQSGLIRLANLTKLE